MARVRRMGDVKAEVENSQARGRSAHERTPMVRVEGVGGVKVKAESLDANEESAHERTPMARVERMGGIKAEAESPEDGNINQPTNGRQWRESREWEA